MENTAIKQRLHHCIEHGDAAFPERMCETAKAFTEDPYHVEYDFTDDEIRELNERSPRRSSGQSKVYSWEETMDIITGKKKME